MGLDGDRQVSRIATPVPDRGVSSASQGQFRIAGSVPYRGVIFDREESEAFWPPERPSWRPARRAPVEASLTTAMMRISVL
jgi:hypothetical protein